MQDLLTRHLRDALAALAGVDFDAAAVEVEYQTPKDPSHGDVATNLALQLARPLSRPPRQIAEALAAYVNARVADDAALARQVAGVEVAGPGFLNVRLAATGLTDGLRGILEAGAGFGRTDAGGGRTAIVEYVSANPTGPLTVGHGRNAVLGDTFANLLTWTGWEVTREYYFNNAGRQMRILGQSVKARAEELLNPDGPVKTLDLGADESAVVPASFPEDGYVGEYIIEIAYEAVNDVLFKQYVLDAENDERVTELYTDLATQVIFSGIDKTLEKLGIKMDKYFNESDLYGDGRRALIDTVSPSYTIGDVLKGLRSRDLIYEKDGATWFKTSLLGKVQADAEGERGVDTVLVKSTGEPTYRLPDIAYHMDKLARGFDLVLDVFGADHIATYPDVLRGVEALGGDPSKIDVVVYQFVTLVRGGEPFKMSTRKARYVTLDDLMEEVGADVTRFFFLMRSPNTHLEFDLDLAKEASEKNPVFYLQMQHARICSILRKAEEVGLTLDSTPDFSLLTHETEIALMKELLRLPEVVADAAEARAPHKVATYLRDAASAFSQFFTHCRIIGQEESLAVARLHLAEAARIVLANGLAVLGITAPERMDREEPAEA